MASKEGRGGDMPVRVKMPSCFGSSKQPKTELMWEPALQRGPLWKSIHYVECNLSGELLKGSTGKPLYQELLIHLTGPLGKLKYMPTNRGHPPPLTLATCHPGWDDYLDLTETVTEMAHCLMKEDGQEVAMLPKVGTTPKKKEAAKSIMAPVNEGIAWVTSDQFPSDQRPGTSRDNPVHLSDATDASASGSCPRKDDDFDDEAKLLGNFSNALREMATSIVDLEEGYIRTFHEVIMETKRALRDVSRINTHYVSQVITVMSSWQEVVPTTASHMEGIDTTIYLTRREDAQKVTREYVAAVVKAREECDTAHAVEEEARRQALKDDNHGDPVVCLLHVTRTVAHTQCEKAVDAFLSSIKKTLAKHVPVHAQGPLISNALSTAFQFQMSMWHMIGEECIHPVQAKHSDLCGLASIVQAMVEMFPKNCALMFPPPPPPSVASFSTTFRPQSSDDDNDDTADNYGASSSFRRFDSSLSAPACRDLSRTGHLFMSNPLLHRGAFRLSTNPKEPPSSSLGMAPDDDEERGSQLGDDNLDIDVVCQTRYKMDLQHFQTYRLNKIDPDDMASINTKDHSAYIEVAQADPGSVIRKSIFSVVAYGEVLKRKGGDVSRFDKEVDTKFKKGPQGSWAPDTEKVAIKRVMLVCQHENGVNVKYSDSDGFGHPGTMGLWNLHSSNALNWAKMQLPSGSVDVNFCPCCMFWSTNNETLNNHVHKHYGMGLTCQADGFTTASVDAMKLNMESEHGYEGKRAGVVKKPKGKG